MKLLRFALLACLAMLGFTVTRDPQAATPQVTYFSYQGQLDSSGALANGTFTMTFKLFDALTGGNQIALAQGQVHVVNGLFTVAIDYGQIFEGTQYWLDITVNGETLTPRQRVNTTPVAQYALSAPNGVTSITASPTNSQWLWNSSYTFRPQPLLGLSYYTRYYDIAVPGLTQDILDHGTVQVFFTPDTSAPNNWAPLPFSFVDFSTAFNYRVVYTTTVGSVRLHFFLEKLQDSATLPQLSVFSIATYTFKVVTTPGTGG